MSGTRNDPGPGWAARVLRARRFLILADNSLGVFSAKTAVCLLRYRAAEVVALVDSGHVGASTRKLLGVDVDRPVVACVEDGLAHTPDTLVIGVAPRGGALPAAWRDGVVCALRAGLDVISGLHVFLSEDPEFESVAREHGGELIDLRRPPADLGLPRETMTSSSRPRVVLSVGSDCNVGKMTTSLEMARAARARGLDSVFGATGQTGILLAGAGIAVDRVIADFMAGAAERIVDQAGVAGWLFLEGQGSLLHPAYSGVTLALVHGARPDALVLCHHVGRREIEGYGVPIPAPARLRDLHEQAAAWVRPAPVIGFALNPHGARPDQVARYAEQVRVETGLPAVDPLTGAGVLVEAAVERLG